MAGDEKYKGKNHLYVIFHGSWAFVDNRNDKYITAYAANIPEHTFKAGSFLGERKIVQGAHLELQIGDWTCETDHTGWHMREHLNGQFVLFCERPARTEGSYASVCLPRPHKIHPQIHVGNVGIGKPICDSAEMYLVPVFHYAYDDSIRPDAIVLRSNIPNEDPFWTADPPDSYGVTTLHCFAADDIKKRANVVDDFSSVGKLLGYDNVTIPPGANQQVTAAALKTTIGRMKHREYEITTFLDTRLDWLRKIAHEPTLPDGLRPMGPSNLNLDYTSCGGGGGGS